MAHRPASSSLLLSQHPPLIPDPALTLGRNGSTVKMKKLTAGSKAKTVQLADFKCSVCPLNVPIEKLLPKERECVAGQEQQPVGDGIHSFVDSALHLPANRKAEGFPRHTVGKDEGTGWGS